MLGERSRVQPLPPTTMPGPETSSIPADLSTPAETAHTSASVLERWAWLKVPLAVFAFSRVAIALVTGWGLTMDPRLHRGSDPLVVPFIQGLCRWDCGWYLTLATDGYSKAQHAAFFPGYPLLARIVGAVLPLPMNMVLVLVANLCALVAYPLVYRVFERVSNAQTASLALTLLVAWPFAFFQAAGYTDGLTLLTTALAIWLALERRHLLAGVALGAAGLTRHLALLAGLLLVIEQLRQADWDLKRAVKSWNVLGLVIPLALVALYPVFLAQRFGDPLLFWHLHNGEWQSVGIWTWFAHPWWPEIGYYLALWPIPIAGAVLLWKDRTWWGLAAFASAYALAISCLGLTALGRYSGMTWPAFLGLAVFLQKRPALQLPVLLGFSVLQGMFLFLFTHSYPIN